MKSQQHKENIDYLIVGQGLAGTLLAYFLLKEKQRIKVIDCDLPGVTSKIAAGVINPVTGRRIAKSWRFEELFSFAKKTYLDLEKLLGIPLWQEPNILRALFSVFEENEWARRAAFPDYLPYFAENADLGNYKGRVKAVRAWGEIQGAAQVAMPELINSFRAHLIDKGLLLEIKFDHQQVLLSESGVEYGGMKAKRIIFCEGAKTSQNPFFSYLPFVLTKGELVLVRIPDAGFKKMLKHRIFIVPLKNDLYWVGSTSRFEFEGEAPSPEIREWFEQQLHDLLSVPFEIIAHLAGIRPTVSDIRPFLGAHPVYNGLAIFNGLGTKGASLAPFFAKQMCDWLLGKTNLDPEVDIKRFEKNRKSDQVE